MAVVTSMEESLAAVKGDGPGPRPTEIEACCLAALSHFHYFATAPGERMRAVASWWKDNMPGIDRMKSSLSFPNEALGLRAAGVFRHRERAG